MYTLEDSISCADTNNTISADVIFYRFLIVRLKHTQTHNFTIKIICGFEAKKQEVSTPFL